MTSVAVVYSNKSKGMVNALKRCNAATALYGFGVAYHQIDKRHELPDADLIVLDGYLATDFALDHYAGKPLAILEKADSASVFFRDVLKDTRVDYFIKVSKLHPEFENHRNYRFEDMMSGGDPDAEEKLNVLSDQDLKKVVCGPSFFAYNALESWQELSGLFDKERHVDVHCVCSTEKYSKPIQSMRRLAIKKIANMKGVKSITGENKIYSNAVYREQMIDSKIVVAPFGNGYMSYRMAEAMLAGAILIAPSCNFAEAAGDPLRDFETYFPCEGDYSDLEETITGVLNGYDDLIEMRKASRLLAHNLWTPYFVAKNFSITLNKLRYIQEL
jgi:hypothetical protein